MNFRRDVPYYTGRFITSPLVETIAVPTGLLLLENLPKLQTKYKILRNIKRLERNKFIRFLLQMKKRNRYLVYLLLGGLAGTSAHLARKHLVKSLQAYNPDVNINMPGSFYFVY